MPTERTTSGTRDTAVRRELETLGAHVKAIEAQNKAHDMTLARIAEALWGRLDSTDEERKLRPGLVAMTLEMYEERKRSKAVRAFLITVMTTLGIGQTAGIIVIVLRILSGDGP